MLNLSYKIAPNRRAQSPHARRLQVVLFANRFSSYIFEQEFSLDAVPAENSPEGLGPYQHTEKDTFFTGAKTKPEFHIFERNGHHVHLNATDDYVRAEQMTEPLETPEHTPLGTTTWYYAIGNVHCNAEIE